jgi:hypothetical protein
MKHWKACERCVAELLGGRRVPVSSRARDDCPDVAHERLSIEVKSRKRLPGWLEEAIRQAEASSKDGQVSVAILHQDGRRYADCLVVLRLKNFIGYAKGEIA